MEGDRSRQNGVCARCMSVYIGLSSVSENWKVLFVSNGEKFDHVSLTQFQPRFFCIIKSQKKKKYLKGIQSLFWKIHWSRIALGT